MLTNVGVGCVLLILTTVVHGAAMDIALRRLKIADVQRWAQATVLAKVAVVVAMVLIMFLASLIEAGMWAGTYLAIGALSGIEQAFYFSVVTYTTLGYGDVVVAEGWRLLSSLEAANGIIMFGWTTALIVTTVGRVYTARSTTRGG